MCPRGPPFRRASVENWVGAPREERYRQGPGGVVVWREWTHCASAALRVICWTVVFAPIIFASCRVVFAVTTWASISSALVVHVLVVLAHSSLTESWPDAMPKTARMMKKMKQKMSSKLVRKTNSCVRAEIDGGAEVVWVGSARSAAGGRRRRALVVSPC